MGDDTQVDAGGATSQEGDRQRKSQTYDCNICFEDVIEPVVTRCGHLFCWACLLTWMNKPNDHCPVCQAGITKENVIPLYGRGQEETDPRAKTSEPRPKPQRPEPNRQQEGNRSLFGGMTVSMFAFPFSIVLPLQMGGQGSMGFLNFANLVGNTEEMTPEQRRAHNNSLALITLGMAIIAYIVLVM